MADSEPTNFIWPRPWGAWDHVIPRPRGLICSWCSEPFGGNDWGVMQLVGGCEPYFIGYHRECFLRKIVGSLGHQKEQCSCFGGTEEDPAEMTLRQAAVAAVEYHQAKRRGPRRVTPSDFEIGTRFYLGDAQDVIWRCTDVGSRTIIAIELTPEVTAERWDAGPPYAVEEVVFDEYDLEAVHILQE